MKQGDFNKFRFRVELDRDIWKSEDWGKLTELQALITAQDLDRNPHVKKLERNGEKVYIFPNGREWQL